LHHLDVEFDLQIAAPTVCPPLPAAPHGVIRISQPWPHRRGGVLLPGRLKISFQFRPLLPL